MSRHSTGHGPGAPQGKTAIALGREHRGPSHSHRRLGWRLAPQGIGHAHRDGSLNVWLAAPPIGQDPPVIANRSSEFGADLRTEEHAARC